MDGWKQCFVLLLPLCVSTYSKETVVKTIGREPDITPVCIGENFGIILLVICRISTERHQGKERYLLYIPDKQFDHKCDSRFTLINENQTVFIHLTSLTPVDSGNYTCECSYERGTHVVHLNITVEADEEDSTFSGTKFIATVVIILTVAATFIITAGIICGYILRRNHHRGNTRSGASELRRSETPRFLDQDNPYASLQQPTSDVYQTISSSRPHYDAVTDPANINAMMARFNQETDGNEKDFLPIYTIYETI